MKTFVATLHPGIATIPVHSVAKIAAGAFLALFRFKLGMMKTLAASALAGLAWLLIAS